jgi:peptide chain release factor subunit 1
MPPPTATTLLDQQLDRLAAFEPIGAPFISLYLNTQANDHGRTHFEPFIRKDLHGRVRAYEAGSPERAFFEQDLEKIDQYLANELQPSSNGVAIFACAAADFFEAVQLQNPIDENELYVTDQPHLYTLSRLNDQYPCYAAVVADTNSARLFVFGLNTKLAEETVENEKTKGHQRGGWSQARYQRHVGNFRMKHVKDVIDALERVVSQQNIKHIVFAGDEVVLPILREQLPQAMEEKLVDYLKLDIQTPETQVLDESLKAIRDWDQKNDREKIERLFDLSGSAQRAAIGVRAVLEALQLGQVEELFLTASLNQIDPDPSDVPADAVPDVPDTAAGTAPPEAKTILIDALITQARQTGAHVTFIEDASLLEKAGGIAATLRFNLELKDENNGQAKT